MNKRVLVIGTSPRIKGNSNILAKEFAKGVEQGGNDVEFIPLAGKKTGFCAGCWGCAKTHRCVFHDDTDKIVQKMKNADAVAFASPIYYYEMCGQMKALLDRTNCLYNTDYKFRDIYLLFTAESTSPDAVDYAIGGVRGWLKVFNKARISKVIFAGGTTDDGTVNGHAELEQARNAGLNV